LLGWIDDAFNPTGTNMNKMLIVVFDNEAGADAGLHALRKLHSEGDITLYASGVIAMDPNDNAKVLSTKGQGSVGAGVGLAVGGLIGLLGGPVGLAIGAVTGVALGAVRDFWVAGVGLDFVEEAKRFLKPGKVALVAEIEEEWITPVNMAMVAAGGMVFRRSRMAVAEHDVDHGIAALKIELRQLEAEASHASGDAKLTIQAELAKAKSSLDGAIERAKQRVVVLKAEADKKAELISSQLSMAQGEAKTRIEDRVKRVKHAYHARGAKLAQAWELTKEALAV
jgi:uncharacterized membrane protein